jgi:hypothetical protein
VFESQKSRILSAATIWISRDRLTPLLIFNVENLLKSREEMSALEKLVFGIDGRIKCKDVWVGPFC